MDFILKHDMEIAESKIKACIKIAHKRYIKEKNYRSNFLLSTQIPHYGKFHLMKLYILKQALFHIK